MPSSTRILNSLGMPAFRANRFIKTGWSQTIVGHILSPQVELPEEKYHQIPVNEKDQLLLVEYSRENHNRKAPILVLIHGLNGCYKSNYMQRNSEAFLNKGYRVFCMNLRNSGPGLGLSTSCYNAGLSDDFIAVYKWIKATYEDSPVLACGFSLGANLLLKAVGEYSFDEKFYAVAVSPPADLLASSNKLSRKKNSFFDFVFSVQTASQLKRFKPYVEVPNSYRWRPWYSLRDIDENYTAPAFGYSSAQDYYSKASAKNSFADIKNKTLIINAVDDPVVCPEVFKGPTPETMQVILTENGGHVAFLHEDKDYFHWMDELILRWASEHISS